MTNNSKIAEYASYEEASRVATLLDIMGPGYEHDFITLFTLKAAWGKGLDLNIEDLVIHMGRYINETVDLPVDLFKKNLKFFLEHTSDELADIMKYAITKEGFKDRIVEYDKKKKELVEKLMGIDDYTYTNMITELMAAITDYCEDIQASKLESDLKDEVNNYLSSPIDVEELVARIVKDKTPTKAPPPGLAPQSTAHINDLWQNLLTSAHRGQGPGSGRVKRPKQEASFEYGKQVFDPEYAAKVLDNMPPMELGESSKPRKMLAELSQQTGYRELKQVHDFSALDILDKKFPHFSEVTEFIRESLATMACGEEGAAVKIPPILLRGVPGTGKTHYAQEVAKIIKTEFFYKDLSLTTEAFVLTGMDPAWKGSKAGLVFESMINGSCANPIILLDEVDKCRVSGHHASPMTALHALLEPTTASKFQDEFISLPLDASSISWILTANDGHIPEPVLTRLEVFDIQYPSPDQCEIIAQSVWDDIYESKLPKGHPFNSQLPDNIKKEMRNISPRNMRKILTNIVGKAALKKRTELQAEDLKLALAKYEPKATGSMGFLSPSK